MGGMSRMAFNALPQGRPVFYLLSLAVRPSSWQFWLVNALKVWKSCFDFMDVT